MAGNGKQVNVPPINTSNETVPASISSSQCILELEKSEDGKHTDISENIGIIYNNKGIKISFTDFLKSSLRLSYVYDRPTECLCVIEGWILNERSEKLTRILLHSKLLTITITGWDLLFSSHDASHHIIVNKKVNILFKVKILNEGINLEKPKCTNCSSEKINLLPVRTTRNQEELSEEASRDIKLSGITGIKTTPASITSFQTLLELKKYGDNKFEDFSSKNGIIYSNGGIRIQFKSISRQIWGSSILLDIYGDFSNKTIIPCIIEGWVLNENFVKMQRVKPDCVLLGKYVPPEEFILDGRGVLFHIVSNEIKIILDVKIVEEEIDVEKTMCSNCSNKRPPLPVNTTRDQSKRTKDHTYPASLVKDLGRLLEEGNGDVTLLVEGGKNLKVHKAIITARSPVLASSLSEAGVEHHIQDVDFDVMKGIVRYMYTDHIEDFKTNARKLYPVACKFALNGLKEQCEEEMKNSLTPENATETLVLVDAFSEDIKSKVLEYMKVNFEDIKNSAGFESMVSTHPDLYMQLTMAILGVKAKPPAHRAA